MRTPALPSPRHLAAGIGLAVLAAGVAPIAASANPAGTGLVISEVYGAGGNGTGSSFRADFIELYNPTSSSIDVSGWSVQYRSTSGTSVQNSASGITPLTGSVPAKSHYLVAEAVGGDTTAPALPAADVTGSIAMGGGAGQVLLVTSTTASTVGTGNLAGNANLVDMVGYGAAGSYESVATGIGLTNVTSASRDAEGTDTDHNANDFTEGAPDPQNASDAGNPDAPVVDEVDDKAFAIDEPITPFTVSATGGQAPYSWSAAGLPAGLDIDAGTGEVSGTPTAAGSSDVTVTVTDGADATGSTTFSITVNAAPGKVIPIAEIQGTGAASPLDGQTVTTEGVVTGSYATGGLNGFYLQTPGADTPDASDAVFVYGGTSGFTTYPAVGDSVEVTGEVDEFFGTTQLVTNDAGVVDVDSLGQVVAKTQIPGTDCALPGTACLSGAALDQVREVAEGELFQPTAPWTATDVYDGGPYYSDGSNSSAFRGEIGVAADSRMPLVAPTEVIDAQATARIAERKAYNDAHRIILDDGSSWTYSTSAHADDPLPWFTADHTVRVGAAITFPKPVIFTFGFNAWRILPQSQVTGDPTGTIDFAQTRPTTPEDVGGDLTLATFNVLNFFPTTGEEFVASGLGTCTYYSDRAGNKITNNRCDPNGPRGAANDANLERQRDKIVSAINTADADIVSLEELENSVKFDKPRDFAINELVKALNADAGAGTWAAVPSAPVLPPTSDQDVIRNGFIYQPANVALVGDSVVLSDESSTGEAFADAREPLAQAFKRVGTPDGNALAVIVNHFKSKGSGNPDPDGQGNATDQRVAQAASLVRFADAFKTSRNISRVFLAGDFNAYSEEDPIQVLEAAGYVSLDSTSNPDEETYNFDGQIGSLDHVLANEAALADVNAVDVWDINGYESVYYEYSRFNSNVTNLYAVNPFRSSDHSPEIVGINTVDPQPVTTTVTGTAAPVEYGTEGSVDVTVQPLSATGTVTLSLGTQVVGSGTLESGRTTIALPARSLPVGTYTLALAYSGDTWHEPSTGSVSVTVTKADATLSTEVKPGRLVAKDTKPVVQVTVAAEGFTPTGRVSVSVDGRSYWADLRNGVAVVELKKFNKAGTYASAVSYYGDASTNAATTIVEIVVEGR